VKDKKVIDRKSVNRLIESNRLELKRILNDSLEKEVVSFLINLKLKTLQKQK